MVGVVEGLVVSEAYEILDLPTLAVTDRVGISNAESYALALALPATFGIEAEVVEVVVYVGCYVPASVSLIALQVVACFEAPS